MTDVTTNDSETLTETAPDHFMTDPVTKERVRNAQPDTTSAPRGPISSSRPMSSYDGYETIFHTAAPAPLQTQPTPRRSGGSGSNQAGSQPAKRRPARSSESSRARGSARTEQKNAARKYLCPIEGCDKRYQQTCEIDDQDYD